MENFKVIKGLQYLLYGSHIHAHKFTFLGSFTFIGIHMLVMYARVY